VEEKSDPKRDTCQRIKEILEENPNQTLQQVGDKVGVSRERVRQHIVKLGGVVRNPLVDKNGNRLESGRGQGTTKGE